MCLLLRGMHCARVVRELLEGAYTSVYNMYIYALIQIGLNVHELLQL